MIPLLLKKVFRQQGKRLLSLLLFFLLLFLGATAQRKCGTTQAIKDALQRNPKLAERLRSIEQEMKNVHSLRALARIGDTILIPVVVHIVLKNPTQVTDAQVQSQIDVLNEDYNAVNTDIAKVPDVWKPLIGSMVIKYTLAKRTPDNKPTNGIERTVTTRSSFSITNAAANVKHIATGGADSWDSQHYLNIWVCSLQDGYLGVTTLPGLYAEDEDGVVITSEAFGTVGNINPEYNKGRTATHEVGHYWNLLHPWGNEDSNPNCSEDDSVADTPLEDGPYYGCYNFPQTDHCSPAFPGVMFMNYMDYADDSCMHLFTAGQVSRMLDALYSFRSSLLSSNGAVPIDLKQTDAEILRISSPGGKVCDGNIAPVITVRNYGNDTLHTLKISYETEDGQVNNYNWSGQLATFDTVQLTLPAINVAIGTHTLTVYSSLPNNTADEQMQNDTASAGFHLDPVLTADFTEGFEGETFPPLYWEIVNPDNSYTWQQTTTASHSGSASAMMDNFDYAQNGPTDDLLSPVINLSNADSAFLFFDVAAAVQSSLNGNNQYWDTLEVLISQDCGKTGTLLYKRWGKNLVTDTTPVTSRFVPSASQWRRDSINLTEYIHSGNFQLIFRNITNFENNIYIDDVNVQTRAVNPILKQEKVLVVPNPTSGIVLVEFLEITSDLKGVEVYNTLGQRVARVPASAAVNNRITLNLANAPNGIYFVKILYRQKDLVKKIVKLP